MKANLSSNAVWILQDLQILVLLTSVNSPELEKEAFPMWWQSNCHEILLTPQSWWCQEFITADQVGFPCATPLFYVQHGLNMYLLGTAAFILLCRDLIAVFMAFWLVFTAMGASAACSDITKWDQHVLNVQSVITILLQIAQSSAALALLT